MVDGKQVSYPNDDCPICGTAKKTEEKQPFIPTAYRKGNTVVTKASRFKIGTDTYWTEGKCILHSLKQVQRYADKKLMTDNEGKLVWNQITFRMSLDLAKQYVTELSKLIQDVEGGGNVPQRE